MTSAWFHLVLHVFQEHAGKQDPNQQIRISKLIFKHRVIESRPFSRRIGNMEKYGESTSAFRARQVIQVPNWLYNRRPKQATSFYRTNPRHQSCCNDGRHQIKTKQKMENKKNNNKKIGIITNSKTRTLKTIFIFFSLLEKFSTFALFRHRESVSI